MIWKHDHTRVVLRTSDAKVGAQSWGGDHHASVFVGHLLCVGHARVCWGTRAMPGKPRALRTIGKGVRIGHKDVPVDGWITVRRARARATE